MQNLITESVKKAAAKRVKTLGIQTYTRLRVNNETTDIVISKDNLGVNFYYAPASIEQGKKIMFITFFDLDYAEFNK